MHYLWRVTVVRVAEWVGVPAWGVLVVLVGLMAAYGIIYARVTR